MALEIECYRCGEELKTPGPLFFGGPTDSGMTLKLHLCLRCGNLIYTEILNAKGAIKLEGKSPNKYHISQEE